MTMFRNQPFAAQALPTSGSLSSGLLRVHGAYPITFEVDVTLNGGTDSLSLAFQTLGADGSTYRPVNVWDLATSAGDYVTSKGFAASAQGAFILDTPQDVVRIVATKTGGTVGLLTVGAQWKA